MTVDFAALLDAFEAANSGEPGMACAYVSTRTGETHVFFEDGDNEEVPEDLEESSEYIALPDKCELVLGQPLVWEFVRAQLPEEEDRVRDMFRGRGAYGRFKHFLDERELLEA